jgi:NAD(P)-dependent dehydrogenase (short-subunit alcohol dehydrogenase family)
MRLAGRRFLVTGAASGIGLATARLFRAEGAAVALVDRDEDRLDAVTDELAATDGPTVAAVPADVADAESVEAAVTAAGVVLGGLDGLVCCAGVDLLKPFAEMTGADWQRVLAVNLNGPFNTCLAALPLMRRAGGGTIVHVASGAALRPLPSRTAYCASKAGLVMFAKSLAVDLAPDGIRVNAICPGIVETPMFRQSVDPMDDPEAELAKILDRYLIKRIGRPLDIANAALFLSCEESAQVTGSALAVDGGRVFH